MNPRTKSALLWGVVGFMTFIVLTQAYAVFVTPLLSITQAAVVALVVGIATAMSAHTLEYRIAAWATRRALAQRSPETDGDEQS